MLLGRTFVFGLRTKNFFKNLTTVLNLDFCFFQPWLTLSGLSARVPECQELKIVG